MRKLLLLWFLLGCSGCGPSLGQAVEALESGRLPEAAVRFRRLEAACSGWSSDQALQLALYAGLTQLALGDLELAQQRLGWVQRRVMAEPGRVSDRERGALFAALRSMGYLPGDTVAGASQLDSAGWPPACVASRATPSHAVR